MYSDNAGAIFRATYAHPVRIWGVFALMFLLGGCATNHLAKTNSDLIAAAMAGDVVEARKQLGQGADVNAENNNGITPLIAAAFYGRKDVAELLLANGAVVNSNGISVYPPLAAAIVQEQKELVDLLIVHGADVNRKLRDGTIPLHLAVLQGSADIVSLLVENGAELDVKDDNGATPLHDAVSSGNRDVVALLIAKGATVDPQDMPAIELAKKPANAMADGTSKAAGKKKARKHRHSLPKSSIVKTDKKKPAAPKTES